MRLISDVRIRGFRSIRDAQLLDLADFTVLAGLNNCGKSNVLRSLNAFFNGYTEGAQPVRVDDDYFRQDLSKKKQKRINVTVSFDLPKEFNFSKRLKAVEALLGGRKFRISKEWTRGDAYPAYYLEDRKLDADEQLKIDQFLQLINFRYIPNRVLPIDVIKAEHQGLRDVLIRRLGRDKKAHAKAFDAIRDKSQKLIGALSNRFRDACPGAGDVRLATPGSWREMVFAFGYTLAQGGVEIEDVAQGSGIQSLLMLETLYLIDRDYFQKFGWRQAAVWAVEEPESSLHSSLEARVANYLASISSEADSRLQILCTTHSDFMVQHSKKAVVVELVGGQTATAPPLDQKAALARLAHAGVSRWVHPLLHHPLEPLVIVEGKFDYDFWQEALRLLRPKKPVQIVYLQKLDEEATGGVEATRAYLKENRGAVKSREKAAPVIVVLDWDAANKKASFERLFDKGDPFHVIDWADTALNPKLGKSFKGIERAFSDGLVAKAEAKGANIGRTKNTTLVVAQDDYGSVKSLLNAAVRQGLGDQDLLHARPVVEQMLTLAGAL